MSGMLRAARRKPASTSAPSMISAFLRPSLSRCDCSTLVLPSAIAALSSTMMPPSLALADNACRSASARTFLGRSIAWLRGVGPNERPPPRNRLTLAGPWRAEPVPFCRYIFLPVRLISLRFLTSWVPAWRLASCHTTQRCRMSIRGSRPKMSSETVTPPAALPSRVVTFSSISRALLRFRSRRGLGQPELARLGRLLRQRLLDGIAHSDPAAIVAGHSALDQNEPALDVGLHHLEIERGDAIDAHVAGHLLVLEGLARILAAAGRAMRAVRDRHAVGGAQAAEIPALHRAGKALADGGAGDVDELPDNEMVGGDLSADRDQLFLLNAELGELALGLDLRGREIAAVGFVHVVALARARAKLNRHVAVLVLGAMRNHLAVGEAEHRHRHMLAAVGKDARHPDLLCDDPGAHWLLPSRPNRLELDLDVHAGSEIELHQRIHGLLRRIDDVEQTLVGAHLELLAALLVDVRRAVDGEFLDLGRQRNRAAHLSACALGGRHDLARRRIEDAVIERLEPDPDVLTVHGLLLHGKGAHRAPLFPFHSVIDTTTPAPTVLPPSRMAKRCFSSIAIGVISSTSMAALSPGMIISVPAGSVHCPVTSVVRK